MLMRRLRDLLKSIENVGNVSAEEKEATESNYEKQWGTSLVAQWLRIHLPMQGTWVRALVREDPTCRGATKPLRHNY